MLSAPTIWPKFWLLNFVGGAECRYTRRTPWRTSEGTTITKPNAKDKQNKSDLIEFFFLLSLWTLWIDDTFFIFFVNKILNDKSHSYGGNGCGTHYIRGDKQRKMIYQRWQNGECKYLIFFARLTAPRRYTQTNPSNNNKKPKQYLRNQATIGGCSRARLRYDFY